MLAFSENRITDCGDNGPHHDLVLRRSSDNGKTWGPMITVVHGKIPCLQLSDLEPKVKVMGGAAEAERSLARTRRATKRIRCVAAQRELAPLLAEAGRAEEALELLEDSHRFELGGPSPTVESLMLHGKLRLRQGPLFDADAGSNSVLLAYELANPVRGTVGGGTLAPICGDDGGQDGCFHVRQQPSQLRWVLG